MGGSIRFTGSLTYPSARHLSCGLDAYERNTVRKRGQRYHPLFDALFITRDENTLLVDYDEGGPAGAYDATERALDAMTRTASSGEIRGYFDGYHCRTLTACGQDADGPALSRWDLFYALQRGDCVTVQAALAAGVPADASITGGRGALSIACNSGNQETLQLLLEGGADVEGASFQDARSVPVAALLASRGLDPCGVGAVDAIGILAYHKQEDVVLWLLAQGCPLSPKAANRIMHSAAKGGQRALVRHLLDNVDHRELGLTSLLQRRLSDPVCAVLVADAATALRD